jgi:hypothetical protein
MGGSSRGGSGSQIHDETAYRLQLLTAFPGLSEEPDLLDMVFAAGGPEQQMMMAAQMTNAIGLRKELDAYRDADQHQRIEIFNTLKPEDVAALTQVGWSSEDFVRDDGRGGGFFGFADKVWDNTLGRGVQAARWVEDRTLEPLVGAIPESVREGAKSGAGDAFNFLDEVGYTWIDVFAEEFKDAEERGIDTSTTTGILEALFAPNRNPLDLDTYTDPNTHVVIRSLYQDHQDNERFVRAKFADDARDIVGGDVLAYSLAFEIAASRVDMAEAAQNIDMDLETMQGVVERVGIDTLMEAVEKLEEGKVSPGRILADVIGADPSFSIGSQEINVLSGLADMGALLATDPLNMIGSVHKARRAVTWGIDTVQNAPASRWARGIDEFLDVNGRGGQRISLFNDETVAEAVGRSFHRISVHARNNDLVGLLDEFPEMNRFKELFDARLEDLATPQGVHAFFKESETAVAFLSGRTASWRIDALQIPHMTRHGFRKMQRSKLWKARIDWASDGFAQLDEALSPDDIILPEAMSTLPAQDIAASIVNKSGRQTHLTNAEVARLKEIKPELYGMMTGGGPMSFLRRSYIGQKAVIKPIRGAAKFAKTFTTQIPQGGRLLDLSDDIHYQDLRNLVEMGLAGDMPKAARDLWLDGLMRESRGARLEMLSVFYDELFTMAGVKTHEAGRVWAREFIDRFHHAYGHTENATYSKYLGRSGFTRAATVLPITQSVDINVIPDFRQLVEHSRRGTLIELMYRGQSQPILTKLMSNFWKPMVLLRLGFIPRAAGEEFLAAWLRQPGLLKAFPARWAAFDTPLLQVDLMDPKIRGRVLAPDMMRVYNPDAALPGLRWSVRLHNRNVLRRAANDDGLRRRALLDVGYKPDLGEFPLDPDSVLKTKIPDEARKAYEQASFGQVIEGSLAHPEVSQFGWDLGDSFAWRMIYNASDFMRHGVREGFFHLPTKYTKYMKLPSINRLITERPMFALGFSNRGGFLQIDPQYLSAVRSLQFYGPAMRAQTDLVMNGSSGWMDEELNTYLHAQDNPLKIYNYEGGAWNELEVVETNSPWDFYGLGDPYFNYQYHSRVQRTLIDPAVRAGMEEMGYYVSPSVREEILRVMAPSRNVDDVSEAVEVVELALSDLRNFWANLPEAQAEYVRHLIKRWLIQPNDQAALRTLRIEAIFRPEDIDLALKPFANVSPRTRRAMAQWLDAPENLEDLPLWTFDYDVVRSRATARYREVLSRPEFAGKVELSERMHLVEGNIVSNPVPTGHTRLYAPRVSRGLVEQLLTVDGDVPRAQLLTSLENDLRVAGLPPQAVRSVIDGLSPDNLENLLRLHEGTAVPLMSLGISDPKLAQRISEFFDRKYTFGERSVAGVYGVDIRPEKILEGSSIGRTDNRIHRFLRDGEIEYYFVPPRASLHSAPVDIYEPNFSRGPVKTDAVTREMALDQIADDGISYAEELFVFRGQDGLGNDMAPELLNEVLSPSMIRRRPDDPLDYRQEVMGFTQNFGTIEDIHMVPGPQAPQHVSGPRLQAVTQRSKYSWHEIVRFGFDKVIGPSVNAMVRRPMFIHQYANGYREGMNMWRQFMDPDIVRVMDNLTETVGNAMDLTFDIARMTPDDIHLLSTIVDDPPSIKAVFGQTTIARQFAQRDLATFTGAELDNMLNVLVSRLDRGKIAPHYASQIEEMLARTRLTSADFTFTQLMDDISRTGKERFKAIASGLEDPHGTVLGQMTDLAPAWMRNIDAQTADLMLETHRQFIPLQEKLAKTAANRAINEMIPFIDDHRFRSQFQEWTFNLIPFWYAEEQFLKRWARVLQWNPAALHQAQLMFMGLENVGFIQNDPVTGEAIFVYPGSPAVTELISQSAALIFGGEAGIPVTMPITGKVKYASPGLDRLGIPSVGPLVSLPMTFISNRYPEWESWRRFEELATGQRGSSRPMLHHVMPSFLRRIWTGLNDDERNIRLMSATNNALAVLEAAGYGPGEDSTPGEREAWVDRVTKAAQHLMFAESFFSWLGPSAPSSGEIITDPQTMSLSSWTGIGHEDANMQHIFQQYMGFLDDENTTYDDIVKAFIQNNPDASPFVVFDSEIPSGAPLPTTSGALDFLEGNADFLTEFPMAGPWMVNPDVEFDNEFDYDAWSWHLAHEWRIRQAPDEFYEELLASSASREFYEEQERKDEELRQIANSRSMTTQQKAEARRQVNERWRNFSHNYDVMHPVFAERRVSGEGRNRRREVINQLQDAIDHPDYPDTDHAAALARMVRAFNTHETQMRALAGDQTKAAREMRERLRASLMAWGTTLVEDAPSTRRFWSSVIVPAARLEELDG